MTEDQRRWAAREPRSARERELGRCPAFTPFDRDSQGFGERHWRKARRLSYDFLTPVVQAQPRSSLVALLVGTRWPGSIVGRGAVAVAARAGRASRKREGRTPHACSKKSASCRTSFGRAPGSSSAGRSPACSGRTTIPVTVPTSTPSTCRAGCSRESALPTRWRVTGRTSRQARVRPCRVDGAVRTVRVSLHGRHR